MTDNTVILIPGMEPKESVANPKLRRSARYNLGAAVELTRLESGRTKVGLVRALSLHGCFVKTEMLFRVGAGVALKIAHSGSEFSAIGRRSRWRQVGGIPHLSRRSGSYNGGGR